MSHEVAWKHFAPTNYRRNFVHVTIRAFVNIRSHHPSKFGQVLQEVPYILRLFVKYLEDTKSNDYEQDRIMRNIRRLQRKGGGSNGRELLNVGKGGIHSGSCMSSTPLIVYWVSWTFLTVKLTVWRFFLMNKTDAREKSSRQPVKQHRLLLVGVLWLGIKARFVTVGVATPRFQHLSTAKTMVFGRCERNDMKGPAGFNFADVSSKISKSLYWICFVFEGRLTV